LFTIHPRIELDGGVMGGAAISWMTSWRFYFIYTQPDTNSEGYMLNAPEKHHRPI
jgi:hypothetical protein